MANPVIHRAEEAAVILDCTVNWLVTKARKREIPFTKAGGKYGWTDDHLAEIIRLFEHQPGEKTPAPRAVTRRPAARAATPPVQRLTARPPRRNRPMVAVPSGPQRLAS